MKQIKQKIKKTAGFSLVEMMTVMLILLLVSSIVAVGIPAAARAYNKVVDAANSQVLISTAMIRLREEIGTASDIVISGTPAISDFLDPEAGDGGESDPETTDDSGEGSGGESERPPSVGREIGYDNSLGIRNRIDCCTDETINENQVIYIQEYADFDTDGTYYHPLVSKSASGARLYVTYDSVSDNHRGVITFHNVVVKNMYTQKEMTDKMDFKVRVLTYIEE